MKIYNLILICGKSKRFYNLNYTQHKVNLDIGNNSLLEGLIDSTKSLNKNYEYKNIIVTTKSLNNKIRFKKNMNFEFEIIFVDDHDRGPLYSLYLFFLKNDLNGNFLISYSDIIFQNDKNLIFNENKSLVFTHIGFHPHLFKNSKSDFCKIKNNQIEFMTRKKLIYPNIFDNYLSLGTFFFGKNIDLRNFVLGIYNSKKNLFNKESYIVDLVNYMISKNILINNYLIDQFYHLGTPDQYIDYLSWFNFFKNSKPKIIKKNNYSSFLLMGGKGTRMKSVSKIDKEFIKLDNKPLYEYSINSFNSDNLTVITTKPKLPYIKSKYKKVIISQTNSMFETIYSVRNELKKQAQFFICSTDCYGYYNEILFRSLIDNYNPDIILFSFNLSLMQKKLSSSHTLISLNNFKCNKILVNNKFKKNSLGLAGFFFINNSKIFNYLQDFNKIFFDREKKLDDYFAYILKKNEFKIYSILLDQYIHLGSKEEFLEYKYFSKFFRKI